MPLTEDLLDKARINQTMRKYTCGCVTLDIPNGINQVPIVSACRFHKTESPQGFHWDDLDTHRQPYRIMTMPECLDVINEMLFLMADGRRFRRLQAILGRDE